MRPWQGGQQILQGDGLVGGQCLLTLDRDVTQKKGTDDSLLRSHTQKAVDI